MPCASLSRWRWAQATAHAQARLTAEQNYLAAREAYAKGNATVLATHARALKGHVLEPYAEFWLLRLRLEQAAPGEVSDFLGRYTGTLVAEQLRREWLLVLGKRQQWELFDAAFPNLVSDDPEVTCYSLQSRWRRGDGDGGRRIPAHLGEPARAARGLRADRGERDRRRQAHRAPCLGARASAAAGGAGRRGQARVRLPAGERAARGPPARRDPLAAGEVPRARRQARPQAAREPRAPAVRVLAAGAHGGVGRRQPLDEEAPGAPAAGGSGVGMGRARHPGGAEPRSARASNGSQAPMAQRSPTNSSSGACAPRFALATGPACGPASRR